MHVKIKPYQSSHGEDCSAPPNPLRHGFNEEDLYEVHGWVIEAGELRAILVNDQLQVWGIANRWLECATLPR